MGEGDLGGIEKDITGDEAVKQLRGLGSWILKSPKMMARVVEEKDTVSQM